MPDVPVSFASSLNPFGNPNMPFSDFQVVSLPLSLPTQPTFMQFPAPPPFTPSSSGNQSLFDGLGSNGSGAQDGFPFPHVDVTSQPAGLVMNGMVWGALAGGAVLGVPGAVGGAVVGGLLGALSDPSGLGIPGIDPSAGSGAQ